MILNANSIVQHIIQNKNGIIKHFNVNNKSIISVEKIIVGAIAHVFVKTANILNVLMILQWLSMMTLSNYQRERQIL